MLKSIKYLAETPLVNNSIKHLNCKKYDLTFKMIEINIKFVKDYRFAAGIWVGKF